MNKGIVSYSCHLPPKWACQFPCRPVCPHISHSRMRNSDASCWFWGFSKRAIAGCNSEAPKISGMSSCCRSCMHSLVEGPQNSAGLGWCAPCQHHIRRTALAKHLLPFLWMLSVRLAASSSAIGGISGTSCTGLHRCKVLCNASLILRTCLRASKPQTRVSTMPKLTSSLHSIGRASMASLALSWSTCKRFCSLPGLVYRSTPGSSCHMSSIRPLLPPPRSNTGWVPVALFSSSGRWLKPSRVPLLAGLGSPTRSELLKGSAPVGSTLSSFWCSSSRESPCALVLSHALFVSQASLCTFLSKGHASPCSWSLPWS